MREKNMLLDPVRLQPSSDVKGGEGGWAGWLVCDVGASRSENGYHRQ